MQAKREKYNWQTDLLHRRHYDFNQSKDEVVKYIRQYIPYVTEEKIEAWERSGALEQMTLDGQKVYFKRAGRNLFRIDPQCSAIWTKAHPEDTLLSDKDIANMRNIPQILRDAPLDAKHTAQSRRMRVTYTLTV
ncbi:MAG: transglutaminase domain-containing protein, partial [Bacteroidaceae bacterium]|nr:transglutaminase domain-containing protein [Bacteroidaceae bacterium]